jgi:uncharacterized protein YvpB
MPKVLLKKQHFKQEIKVSCIPAAARIVLNYLGVTVASEAYLRKILKTKITGTNIFNLGYLKDEKDWGVDVKSELGTLSVIKNYLVKDKIPVIVLIDTSPLDYWKLSAAHVLVVVGFDEEYIIINDPFFENQEIKIPTTIFMEAWSVFQNLLVVIKKR